MTVSAIAQVRVNGSLRGRITGLTEAVFLIER